MSTVSIRPSKAKELYSRKAFAMIFGISVSDIYGCARLAYRLYEEFKQAPGICQELARDLLLFHQVLIKTRSAIDSETSHLSDYDRAALRLCLDSCKELLYVQIVGSQTVPGYMLDVRSDLDVPLLDNFENKYYGALSRRDGLFPSWRQRFEKRKLALRVPKLQRAISAHIEKLNVLLILYVFMIDGFCFFAADLPTS